MKVRIGAEANVEEAAAIARAMATHAETDVEVYVGDDDEPAATGEADLSPVEDDLGPTDRERDLLAQIEAIETGGPEKYKEQLPEEGKLFVRDRLELWFGADGLTFEDGRFAEFDADDELAADGLDLFNLVE